MSVILLTEELAKCSQLSCWCFGSLSLKMENNWLKLGLATTSFCLWYVQCCVNISSYYLMQFNTDILMDRDISVNEDVLNDSGFKKVGKPY